MKFQNKVVLVTGGASGIGAAAVCRFAEEGAQVIVADRDVEKGKSIIAQIQKRGRRGFFQEVDLVDEGSIERCGIAVAEKVSVLHVLVNNAAIAISRTIEETSREDWEPQMAINLRAPALMARALLPLMKKEGGAIVNISSEAAFRPGGGGWVYRASKAGICALTRSMAAEFAPINIRVNTIAPGWTVTEMHFGKAKDPQARKKELENLTYDGCVSRRLGRPEEIANAIVFLASDEASYITATTLHVDGGRVAH